MTAPLRPSSSVKRIAAWMGLLLLSVVFALGIAFFLHKDTTPQPSSSLPRIQSPAPRPHTEPLPVLSPQPLPPPDRPFQKFPPDNVVPQILQKALRHCIRLCSQEELLHFMEENRLDFHMQWREKRIFTVFDSVVRFRPETALHLLHMGRIVVSQHPQALSAAVISGNEELVALLLDLGADPNGHGSTGPSPFLLSVTLGKVAIMDLLQASGSRMDPVYLKRDAMDLAVRSHKTRVSNMRRLVKEGFTIEARHIENAVRHGNLGNLAYLLKLRPDLRDMRHRNTDIVSMAIQYKRPLSFIRYLHLTGTPLTQEHLDLARNLLEEKTSEEDPISRQQARILETIIPYIEKQLH